MDLLDFEAESELYFDEELPDTVTGLIRESSENYGEDNAMSELCLLRALLYAPQSLSVLVALYRFFYYQHRLEDTLIIAEKALSVSREASNFPEDWRDLTLDQVSNFADKGMGMARFYLFTLKGIGFLHLRMHNFDKSVAIFEKLRELDDKNRLGVKDLLDLAKNPVEEPPEEDFA